ncbi:iron-containing alcohol dehydrogenase [Bacilliculturomica massiliensis]|uniref:iron-containing alcohol dehydrogenase n=1 Tax=Bacilliculturomica massiliensis TaxID=1917867 RepID=UPI0010325BD1|nr:iron-containing alcohol dehydrogenase [Bacilliculturomica massiliensis]
MSTYEIKIPSAVYGGCGSISKVRELVRSHGREGVLLFTDRGVRGAGLCDGVLDMIREEGADCAVIDDLTAEPAAADVQRVADEARTAEGAGQRLILAVGGGSVMDAAKLCSVILGAGYDVKDLLESPELAKKQRKTVMIPTTCGTGSEATCNAIVAIPEEDTKKGIVSAQMIPDYVILDGDMIARLPKAIVAATGVDALAHAVECYTSKKATPFSDTYALASAALIMNNIQKAYSDPDDMEAKNAMLLGAFYGGAAITGSGTTAVHALSYPLGGKYHIAHGVSNAILFAHVMAFNKDGCADRLAALCDAVEPELSQKAVEEKAQRMIDRIAEIVSGTNIPVSLQEFGITPGDLDFLVEAAGQQQRLLVNNCKELSAEDIRAIYEKVI